MAREPSSSQLMINQIVYPTRLDSQHFRLIKLDTSESSNNDDIFYSLSTFDLAEPPAFCALSYTWSDAEDAKGDVTEEIVQLITPFRVHVNKHKFAITENLHDALVMLRQQESRSYIWIDAICINQYDPVERSLQVSVMDRIYQSAHQVIVWVGPDTRQDARQALELLRKLALWFGENTSDIRSRHREGLRLTCSEVVRLAGIPELGRRLEVWSDEQVLSWKPFMDFFRRRWFSRTWTVQETVLARRSIRVFCGETEFSWSEIMNCCVVLRSTELGETLGTAFRVHEQVQGSELEQDLSKFAMIPGSSFANAQSLSWLCNEPLSHGFEVKELKQFCTRITGSHRMSANMGTVLTLLLHSTREHQAFEVRDKIYGVLGILSAVARLCGEDILEIGIDYTKPAEFAFSEAARYVLRRSHRLGYLTYVHNPVLPAMPGLPSWVPDFSRYQHNPLLFIDRLAGTACFDASNSYSEASDVRAFSTEENLLLCRGYKIGCVTKVSEPLARLVKMAFCSQMFDLGRQLDYIAEMVLGCADVYCTGQPRVEVLWRTLVANTEFRSYPASSELASSFRYWLFVLMVITHDTKTGNYFDWDYYQEAYTHYDALAKSDSSQTAPNVEALLTLSMDIQQQGDREILSSVDEKASAFMVASEISMLSRSFFVTDTGHMGLGPESTKPGDSVWILAGGATPFILRDVDVSVSDAGDFGYRRMTLTGESYLHGVMHGEALAGIEVSWQDIAIV